MDEGELRAAVLGGSNPDAPRQIAIGVDAVYDDLRLTSDLHLTVDESDATTIRVVAQVTSRTCQHESWKNEPNADCT